ncbi:MAG TPA: hypothetical protein VN726_07865 [Hanamia sp.]|nr:hypothetical protein [Hanamia sp.]
MAFSIIKLVSQTKILKVLLVFFLAGITSGVPAQDFSSTNSCDIYNIDSLKTLYGENKVLLPKYDTVALIALSYYPELEDDYIRFKTKSINSTARTTVTFGSVFKKINKQYIIYINDDIDRTGMLLSQAPCAAQVALIGHELAHVVDFKSRSFFDMAWWGLTYLFIKQRTKIEKFADQTTVKHGLGWQLYLWADYVLNRSTANKNYLKMKQTKYLSPAQILRYMKESGLQANPQ